jgi:hypothetical protein|tara:strand:- start:1799 stop:2677 length:879 start_codon:yes stop_codon:yes gene_type:complete
MTDTQFKDYLTENTQLADRTIGAYKNTFTKFENMNKNVLTQSQSNIINYINDFEGSNNTKLSMINIAIIMRKHHTKEINKILNRKLQLMDDYKQEKNVKKEEKKGDLPTTGELIAHENRLYIDGNWTGYIVTHLLRVLSTRNKDLDLKILPPNRSQRVGVKGDKNNYLIIRSNNAQVIRNNYKTYKQYGQKKNLVPSRKLNRAIREMIAERDLELGKDEINLLSTIGGKRMNEDSIAKKIRSYTFRGLSESDYNKVFVSEVASVKDIKKLEKISNNRGTSLEVLLQEYHLDV